MCTIFEPLITVDISVITSFCQLFRLLHLLVEDQLMFGIFPEEEKSSNILQNSHLVFVEQGGKQRLTTCITADMEDCNTSLHLVLNR